MGAYTFGTSPNLASGEPNPDGSRVAPEQVLPSFVRGSDYLDILRNLDIGSSVSLKNVPSQLGGTTEQTASAMLYILNPYDSGAVFIDQVGATAGAGIVTRHALGTAEAPVDVTDGLQIGYMDFRAYSGDRFFQCGSIAVLVDGTFVSGQAPPTRMCFYTNAANGGSSEGLRIDRNRKVYVGTTAQLSGITGAALTVGGVAGDYSLGVGSSATVGQSFGQRTQAGTNTADYNTWWANNSGTRLGSIRGDGLFEMVGAAKIFTATALPAGGTAGVGYLFSSVANFGVFFGSGAPTLSVAKGSLYLRSDGSGVGDRLYVNTNGTTGWTAVTTAA